MVKRERDRKLAKIVIEVEKDGHKEQYILKIKVTQTLGTMSKRVMKKNHKVCFRHMSMTSW